MTVNEFSREFDILYDNISSNMAPGLNSYEKSVFLTRAQEELIKSYYSGLNPIKQGFEGSEFLTRKLNELTVNYRILSEVIFSPGSASNYLRGMSQASKFYEIPDNTLYIVFEEIKISPCVEGEYVMIEVKPITQDEYNVSIKSPYRKPNKRKAWRVNSQDVTNSDDKVVKVVEIISAFPIHEYHNRYIKKPVPIVLVDFESDPELTGMSLTVDGVNTISQCEMNDDVHRNILDRAVEEAIKAYRENTLQSSVQLNTRNV